MAYVDPKAKLTRERGKTDQDTLKHSKKPKLTDENDGNQTQIGTNAASVTATLPKIPNTPKTTLRKKKVTSKNDRVVRASTKEKTMETEDFLNSRKKRKRHYFAKRKQNNVHFLTQEQLLEEAQITEEINRASLEILTKLEEEKKQLPKLKPTIIGPMIRYLSNEKNGETITWTDPSTFPVGDLVQVNVRLSPSNEICPITGMKAKYFDPKTAIAYANVEAFKQIRERYPRQSPPTAHTSSASRFR